jgi:hypothetical protein
MIKEYEETHQQGRIFIENKSMILNRERDFNEFIDGDIGIQIAKDGRIWVCINGTAFIRFKPILKKGD